MESVIRNKKIARCGVLGFIFLLLLTNTALAENRHGARAGSLDFSGIVYAGAEQAEHGTPASGSFFPNEHNNDKAGETLQMVAGLGVPFVENIGQADRDVLFYANTPRGTVSVTANNEIIYAHPLQNSASGTGVAHVKESFLGSIDAAVPYGSDEAPTRVNYFQGQSGDTWTTDLKTYNRIVLGEIYPDIAVELINWGRNMEKVFRIAPGGNPGDIKIAVQGGELALSGTGELAVTNQFGALYFTKPVAFQQINGVRVDVGVSYRIVDATAYGFALGEYNAAHELIIDPLHYATYIGGVDDDHIYAISLDSQNNVYIAGVTKSWNFPSLSGYSADYAAGTNLFVAKFSRDLSTLLAATFIGGAGDEEPAKKIVIDAQDNVIITGWTSSTDFPVTASAYDTEYNGGDRDSFILKLNQALSQLLTSTFYGGSGSDGAAGVVIAANGDVYITGTTDSADLPMDSSGYKTGLNAQSDGFAAGFSPDLTALKVATYYGSQYYDNQASAINIYDGSVYVVGKIILRFSASSFAAHVAILKFDMGLSELQASNLFRGKWTNHSGYVGGIYDVFFDSDGNTYVSYSAWIGFWELLIVKASPDLVLLGELRPHCPMDPAVLGIANGNLYYAGWSSWSVDGFMGHQVRYFSADLEGAMTDYETFNEGASGGQFALIPSVSSLRGMAFDSDGNLYIAGYADSEEFPVSANPYQDQNFGERDGIIAVLAPDLQKRTESDLELDLDIEEVEMPGGGLGLIVPVGVRNIGPDAPARAKVELTIAPAGAVKNIAVAVPGGDSFVVDGNWVTLFLNGITLVETKSAPVTADVEDDFSGAIEVQATVQVEGGTDPNPGNNSAGAQRVFNALADLWVDNYNVRTEGGNWEHRITVGNLGPTEAANVRLFNYLPPGLRFLDAQPEGFVYDQETNTVRWDLSSLSDELTYEDYFKIATEFIEGYDSNAAMENHVMVESDSPDPDPENNEQKTLFGGQYESSFTMYTSNYAFYLDEDLFGIALTNTGTMPFRPEITVHLPPGIEVVEDLNVTIGSDVGGPFVRDGDNLTWRSDRLLQPGEYGLGERLDVSWKYRVTEWNEDEDYKLDFSAEFKGYAASGELKIARSETVQSKIVRPDLGFVDQEHTHEMRFDEQKQFILFVRTEVDDRGFGFNTRGRARVTMEIVEGVHEQIKVISVEQGNAAEEPPEKNGDHKWEWLLTEGIDKLRDTKTVTIQAGPFEPEEEIEDMVINLEVVYEPGEFDYSEHEEDTANNTGAIRLRFQELQRPEVNLKTAAAFHYDEKAQKVVQTYSTAYDFRYGDHMRDFDIRESYTYLDALGGFALLARPELIEGIDGRDVEYSLPSGIEHYQRGLYLVKIETPVTVFPFGQDLMLRTEVEMEYGEEGAPALREFQQTFHFDLPAPRIAWPTTGELINVDQGLLVAGWAVPNVEIRLRRAGDDQLLATTSSGANGAFFATIPAGRGTKVGDRDTLSFYAVAVSSNPGVEGTRSVTITLTESTHCWDPQRSTWEGTDTRGQKYTFNFRNRDTGRPSTTNWQLPGVFGFWNTTLKIYARTPNPVEIYVIADGTRYDPVRREGNYFIFNVKSAHNVIIYVKCDEEMPAESAGVVLIDPDGFVYDVNQGWGKVVPGARVTAMEYITETGSWVEWPAHLEIYENQVNPQIVGDDGYFAFFTPPGRYYLQVENPEPYQSWRSHDLFVINEIVHRNVPYTQLPAGEPAVTINASAAGLADAEGGDLSEVTIDEGEIVRWVSQAFDGTTLDDLLQLTKHPVVHIESLIDPEIDKRGFDSGMLGPLATYSYWFDYPGEY